MGVKVTVGGKVSVTVGVSDGNSVGVDVSVGVGVAVNGRGVFVGVAVRVRVGVTGIGKVAVTKMGVKEGISAVAVSAAWVAESTHNGVLVSTTFGLPP